ncbi:thioredoxin family protein [Nibribacter ruber]|uniref:Thioredoxin family protein n=1 Tax=Nibribacter ruber TaxID=2698458 RepID=A0A6P1P2Q4_9BACT|nr:thioredoxin family protein [Nibribacter ruber]QHL88687.1 thioredoxin family protein [Nibribacter ruber]
MEANPNVITPEVLAQGLSFSQYMDQVREAVAQHRTTGLEQSRLLTDVTKNNVPIMERTYQTPLLPELVDLIQHLPVPMVWLVLTEGWCGDAAQNVPILASLAEKSTQITFLTILRSEHPAVMDAYLTNGGKSIPKLICLDARTLQPLGSWGPRPQALQEAILPLKKSNLHILETIRQAQQISDADKGQSLQKELLTLIPAWVQAAQKD